MKVSFRELHRTVKLRLIIQFVGGLTSTMVMPFLAIYFSKMVGETLTGLMFVGVLLAGVAGGFFGGYYADKFGRKKVMIICESVSFLTYLLIALFNSPWIEAPYVTALLFVVNVFFGGMFGPAAQAMLLDVSDAGSRKLIFTISYWLGNLAGGLGGILGGFWFEAYHFYLFLTVGMVSLVSVLATVFFISETKPQVESPGVERATPAKKKKKKSGDSKYKSAFKDRPFLLYFTACLLLLTIEQQLPNYIGVRLSKELPDQAIFHSAFWSLKVDGIKMLGILRTENTFLVVLMGALVSRLMKDLKTDGSFC
ncbi:MAG TPA: MFS transporter [Sporolactobacillaceae bacterium]|nr:MFS transporter [Sporolactobacillaceae bacterium]